MARTPSKTTLRIRAIAKVERLKDKITAKVLAFGVAEDKHKAAIDKLKAELQEAETALAEFNGGEPQAPA